MVSNRFWRVWDLTSNSIVIEMIQQSYIDQVLSAINGSSETETPSLCSILNINAMLSGGLIAAAALNRVDAIVEIANSGANVNSNRGKTPLEVASGKGNMNAVSILVEQFGATLDGSALMAATRNSHANVVEFLLDKGADPVEELDDYFMGPTPMSAPSAEVSSVFFHSILSGISTFS